MLGAHRRATIVLVACLAPGGCSLGEDDEPKPVRGAPKQVAQVISRLDTATRKRDFATVCNRLLSKGARRRAGGDDCESLMRLGTKDLRRPRLELLSIVVRSKEATARVRTRARGQAAVDESIELVREGGEYRISALAD